jgi:LPXTG-site transpeptidase (sortase) family protein
MGVALYGVRQTAMSLKLASANYLLASPDYKLNIPALVNLSPTPFQPEAIERASAPNQSGRNMLEASLPVPTISLQGISTPPAVLHPGIIPNNDLSPTAPNYLPTEVAALVNQSSVVEIPEPLPTPFPSPTPVSPVYAPLEQPQIPVKLLIPALEVKRAIVSVGLVETRDGFAWDSDSLFATANRPDLVGHLEGSAYPGEGGNSIFIGHNYDWGIYRWKGVFADLKKLSAGDEIVLITEGGQEIVYIIEEIKELPWSKQNDAEREKHQRFLSPSSYEKITLVTCSGANLGVWNKRVYVVALPRGY